MLEPHHLLTLSLAALAFAPQLGPSKTMAQAASNDVSCEIRVTETSSGVRLQGVVRSKTAIAGDYEFAVDKTGGGGTSSSAQSGNFEAGPQEFGLEDGGVSLAPFGRFDDEVPQEVKDAVDEARQGIIDGDVQVPDAPQ